MSRQSRRRGSADCFCRPGPLLAWSEDAARLMLRNFSTPPWFSHENFGGDDEAKVAAQISSLIRPSKSDCRSGVEKEVKE